MLIGGLFSHPMLHRFDKSKIREALPVARAIQMQCIFAFCVRRCSTQLIIDARAENTTVYATSNLNKTFYESFIGWRKCASVAVAVYSLMDFVALLSFLFCVSRTQRKKRKIFFSPHIVPASARLCVNCILRAMNMQRTHQASQTYV